MLRASMATLALAGSLRGATAQEIKASDMSTNMFNIQLSETLNQPAKLLQVELTAVPQTNFLAAAYLLNGLTDDRKWYQVGLSYKDGSFHMVCEGWDWDKEIFNKVLKLKNIKSGDHVALKLAIAGNGTLTMALLDVDSWTLPIKYELYGSKSETFVPIPGLGDLKEKPHKLFIAHSGTSVTTELYTTNRYATFNTQWYQLDYPTVTNMPLYSITIGKGSMSTPVYSLSAFDDSGVRGRICYIGDSNTYICWGPYPNLFMTQSTTNIVMPEQ